MNGTGHDKTIPDLILITNCHAVVFTQPTSHTVFLQENGLLLLFNFFLHLTLIKVTDIVLAFPTREVFPFSKSLTVTPSITGHNPKVPKRIVQTTSYLFLDADVNYRLHSTEVKPD